MGTACRGRRVAIVIIFDTETTGLPKASAAPLNLQPQIIEFAAVKVDKNLKVKKRIEFLIKPVAPLEPIITKITGLTDKDLADKLEFIDHYPALCDFFLGEKEMLAHNVEFDRRLLEFDLLRIGKQCNFPWPIRHICTVEATFHLENKRLKLVELYEKATGAPLAQTHRAMDDVEALLECVRWCVAEKIPL